jgi:RimJ/RimL family protein N-acetyltransferase
MKFQPLETDAYKLTEFTEQDVDALVRICNDPVIVKYLLTIPSPYTVQDAYNWIGRCRQMWNEGTQLTWAVRLKADPKQLPVAAVELRQNMPNNNIGLWVDPKWRGHKIGGSALLAVLEYAKQIEFFKDCKVHYACRPENTASIRIAEKIGAAYGGSIRSTIPDRTGVLFDFNWYELSL